MENERLIRGERGRRILARFNQILESVSVIFDKVVPPEEARKLTSRFIQLESWIRQSLSHPDNENYHPVLEAITSIEEDVKSLQVVGGRAATDTKQWRRLVNNLLILEQWHKQPKRG